ncbi:GGDEF domain-containing protein [Paenibacillus lautus]
MKKSTPLRRVEFGYFLLIALAVAQQALLFWHIHVNQSFTFMEFMFSIGSLAALLIGFFLPVGVSTVAVFVYLVTYFVWLSTLAPIHALTLSWILLLPANTAIAVFIKLALVRSRRFIRRLEQLRKTNPDIDIDTSLGSKEAFESTLVKQANLAHRYSDQYGFCIMMFKLDFLPLTRENVGSHRFAKLIVELSNTIQKQIRYEDYKFSIGEGRFIILCPLTKPEYLKSLMDRIKVAMMNVPFRDKKGMSLKLVVRAGGLVFQKEQFSRYEHIDDVISALERNTETDLIGEYI